MRSDQERRFQAIIQVQQEDRETFRSWMDREVRQKQKQLGRPHPPTAEQDGGSGWPRSLLRSLRKTAGAPDTLLSGEAQVAAQQLPVQNLLVFGRS